MEKEKRSFEICHSRGLAWESDLYKILLILLRKTNNNNPLGRICD